MTLYLDEDNCIEEIFMHSGNKKFHDFVRFEMLAKAYYALYDFPTNEIAQKINDNYDDGGTVPPFIFEEWETDRKYSGFKIKRARKAE